MSRVVRAALNVSRSWAPVAGVAREGTGAEGGSDGDEGLCELESRLSLCSVLDIRALRIIRKTSTKAIKVIGPNSM